VGEVETVLRGVGTDRSRRMRKREWGKVSINGPFSCSKRLFQDRLDLFGNAGADRLMAGRGEMDAV
jgi:hypothetical protein